MSSVTVQSRSRQSSEPPKLVVGDSRPSGSSLHLADPGNHGDDHFKRHMSPLRFRIRQYLTQYTDTQSEPLARWQHAHATPLRDWYFLYTALLGSHTFYVLFLPMPVWFGYFEATRDLVYLLGYSIYLSGFLKDYWCLPRPRSPPVERVSLSQYTTEEYGAPSSHSANATAVTLYFLGHLAVSNTLGFSPLARVLLCALVLAYYATLVVGRLYCGMHGPLDIVTGCLCGAVTYAARTLLREQFATFESGLLWWFPLASVAWGLALLFAHVRPVDECPCFGDSVAFIGVAAGYECGDWFLQRYVPAHFACGTMAVDGPARVLARPFVAVPLVLLWKAVLSKPLVYGLLRVLRVRDDRAEKQAVRERHAAAKSGVCMQHVGEANIDIVGRFAVYMGVPITVTVVCPFAFRLLGL